MAYNSNYTDDELKRIARKKELSGVTKLPSPTEASSSFSIGEGVASKPKPAENVNPRQSILGSNLSFIPARKSLSVGTAGGKGEVSTPVWTPEQISRFREPGEAFYQKKNTPKPRLDVSGREMPDFSAAGQGLSPEGQLGLERSRRLKWQRGAQTGMFGLEEQGMQSAQRERERLGLQSQFDQEQAAGVATELMKGKRSTAKTKYDTARDKLRSQQEWSKLYDEAKFSGYKGTLPEYVRRASGGTAIADFFGKYKK